MPPPATQKRLPRSADVLVRPCPRTFTSGMPLIINPRRMDKDAVIMAAILSVIEGSSYSMSVRIALILIALIIATKQPRPSW